MIATNQPARILFAKKRWGKPEIFLSTVSVCHSSIFSTFAVAVIMRSAGSLCGQSHKTDCRAIGAVIGRTTQDSRAASSHSSGFNGTRPVFHSQKSSMMLTDEMRSEEHTSELQSLRHLVCR